MENPKLVPNWCARQLSWQCLPLGLRFGFVVDLLIFDQIRPLLLDGAGVGSVVLLRSMLALSPCSSATRATEAPGCKLAVMTLCLNSWLYRLRLGARLTTLISFMIGVRLKIGGHYRIRGMSIQDVITGRIRRS